MLPADELVGEPAHGRTDQGPRDVDPEVLPLPGGESWTDVVLRIRSLLTDLRAEHPGRRVWVFSHQAVIMSFRFLLEGLTEEELLRIDGETPLGNCSLTTYRAVDGGELVLESAGVVDHLDESSAEPTHEEPHAASDPAPADATRG